MLIPESGKPAELDLTLIKSEEDCDIVISWLESVMKDIDRQLERSSVTHNGNRDWIIRTHGAMRATERTKFKVIEMRRAMAKHETTPAEAFLECAKSLFEDEDLEEVYTMMNTRYPGIIATKS